MKRTLDQELERLRFRSSGHPSDCCEALGQSCACGVCAFTYSPFVFIQQTLINYMAIVPADCCLVDKLSNLYSWEVVELGFKSGHEGLARSWFRVAISKTPGL